MLTIDNDGTIYLYQGDSGEIVINGLDDTLKSTLYFAIQDSERKPVGEELQVSANKTDTVTIVLTPEYTTLLTVPKGKPYQIYYYGIKVCEDGSSLEDTMFIENNTYGDLNTLVVFPRKVKGVENGTK